MTQEAKEEKGQVKGILMFSGVCRLAEEEEEQCLVCPDFL